MHTIALVPNPKNKPRKNASTRTMTGFRINTQLLAELDAYIATHPIQPTRTSVVEVALREYLDRNPLK